MSMSWNNSERTTGNTGTRGKAREMSRGLSPRLIRFQAARFLKILIVFPRAPRGSVTLLQETRIMLRILFSTALLVSLGSAPALAQKEQPAPTAANVAYGKHER